MSTKQEIIDYVLHTPGNTNKYILSCLLDSYSGGEDVVTHEELREILLGYQEKLIAGENIQTLNNHDILTSGNYIIEPEPISDESLIYIFNEVW